MSEAVQELSEDCECLAQVGDKYEILFQNIRTALALQNIKFTSYQEEFYICIDMKKTSIEKLTKFIEDEIRNIFRKNNVNDRYLLKVNPYSKKATLFFKKELKR